MQGQIDKKHFEIDCIPRALACNAELNGGGGGQPCKDKKHQLRYAQTAAPDPQSTSHTQKTPTQVEMPS